jgi:hypothetical protein
MKLLLTAILVYSSFQVQAKQVAVNLGSVPHTFCKSVQHEFEWIFKSEGLQTKWLGCEVVDRGVLSDDVQVTLDMPYQRCADPYKKIIGLRPAFFGAAHAYKILFEAVGFEFLSITAGDYYPELNQGGFHLLVGIPACLAAQRQQQ